MTFSWAKRRQNRKIKPHLEVNSIGVLDDKFNNLLACFYPIHKSEELFFPIIGINAFFQFFYPEQLGILEIGVAIKLLTSSFKRVE